MRTYLYPQNLKASANLWLWNLRDFLILCIAVLFSAVVLLNSGILKTLLILLTIATIAAQVNILSTHRCRMTFTTRA